MATYSTEYLQVSARLVKLSTCRPINIASLREPVYLSIMQQGLRIHRFSDVFILLALDLSICLSADVSNAQCPHILFTCTGSGLCIHPASPINILFDIENYYLLDIHTELDSSKTSLFIQGIYLYMPLHQSLAGLPPVPPVFHVLNIGCICHIAAVSPILYLK